MTRRQLDRPPTRPPHAHRPLEPMEPRLLFTAALLLPNPSSVADNLSLAVPPSAALADFNGDGHLDMAESSRDDNLVRVMLGDGAGALTPSSDLNAGGNQPRALVAADFNGDGHPDLADVLWSNNAVAVFYGNGDGTFAPPTTFYTGGNSPIGLAVGDINGDGHPDLVIANSDGTGTGSGQNVAVLLNQGNGAFGAPTTYDPGAYPGAVAVADLNADGRPDVVLTKTNGGLIDVLLTNADGTLAPPVTYNVQQSITHLQLADLNGDGAPDLISDDIYGRIEVMLNQGNGAFAAPAAIASGSLALNAVVGDLDGNGTQDIAFMSLDPSNPFPPFDTSVQVVSGDGHGNFGAPATYATSTQWYDTLATGDFNHDGSADLLYDDPTDLHVALGRSLNLAAHPFSAKVGHSATAVAHVTDNLPGTTAADYTATIDWGDGHANPATLVASPAGGFDVLASHAYATPGPFTAHVTVTASDGASRTATAAITITRHHARPVPPVPPAPSPVPPTPVPLTPTTLRGAWRKLDQLLHLRAEAHR